MSYDGERIPLHDAQTEAVLIGAMLLHERVAVAAINRMRVEDFYRPNHQTIVSAMIELLVKGQTPSDVILVEQHLEATGKLNAVGGSKTLDQMVQSVGSVNNYPSWIDAVREKASLRMLQAAIDQAEATLHSGEAATVVSSLITSSCSNVGGGLSRIVKAGDVPKRKTQKGYPTGIPLIDQETATQGAPKGQMVVTLAASGVGKSTLLVQVLTHAAWDNRGVGYTTLADLNGPILRERILRMICGYSSIEIATHYGHREKFVNAEYELVNQASFYIDDRTGRGNRDVDDILGTIEAVRLQNQGTDQALTEWGIDYGQKLYSRNFHPRDSYAMSHYCSAQISNYAEDSGLTIYVGSQITPGSKREGTVDKTKNGTHWTDDAGLGVLITAGENNARTFSLPKSRFGGQGLTAAMVFDEERLAFKVPGGSF